MNMLFAVPVIVIAAAAAGVLFFVQKKRDPSLSDRNQGDPGNEEEYLPLELYGLYCSIRKGENGLMNNDVFRFYDNAGKTDHGTVLTAVISQRKAGDGYFPKEKWFSLENNEEVSGGRWKRDGNAIRFVIELPKGNIIYKGSIKKNCLILDSYSEITGHRESGREYDLYQFEEVPGWWD